MTAFAVATSLAAFYPVLLTRSACVRDSAWPSPDPLGMHFLSDVLAGAALRRLAGLCRRTLVA